MTGNVPVSTITFHSTSDNSAIYKIEINDVSVDPQIGEKISVIFGATLFSIGVPSDTYKQFDDSWGKWASSRKSLPASKTFKLWHPQMGRYIVVKMKFSGNASLEITIYGKSS